ncbi:MAG: VWA domain-containing protein, partial [Planctomycetales bacterium]|nr:VWA domain-containing protein [Planctomycetales bacterium]
MTYLSKMLTRTASFSFVLALSIGSVGVAQQTGPMGVFRADGSEYFSLSLMADLPAAQQGHNIVVLFDTSASQTGMYRDTALAALRGFVGSLGAEDRVQVFATDLDTRAMNDRFSPANGPDVAAALEKLAGVAPLGSTDLQKALSTAAGRLQESGAGDRVVVYIGDGVSTANLMQGHALSETVDQLRRAHASVNSYAIGPKVDAELLAAIANQSGGNLYVANEMARPDPSEGVSLDRAQSENERRGGGVGRTLADWAKAKVVWPDSFSVSDSIQSLYPAKLPPLRSDRDSVVVGRLTPGASELAIEATLNGEPVVWRNKVTEPAEANAYLAELVDRAAQDNGASLPTLGSAGLNEVARMLNTRVDVLTDAAEKAVATGDRKGAEQIADAVLRRDPGNLRARSVKRVTAREISNTTPAQPAAGEDLKMIRVAQAENVPTPQPEILYNEPTPANAIEGPVYNGVIEAPMPEGGFGVVVEGGDFPPGESVYDDQLLSAVEQQNRVMAKQLEKEVQVALSDARDIMSSSPQDAIQDLKLMLQSVQNAPELLADVRASLVDRLEGALRQAARAAAIKDELDREREESEAASRDRMLMLDRMAQDREREKQLMDTFNALMDEEQYQEAEDVAKIVEEVDPRGVTPVAAQLWSSHKRYYEFNKSLRQLKAERWLDAFARIETASVPFPDEPPIVYPDREFWLEITARREKYKSVSLSGQSLSEQRIMSALASPLTIDGLDFTETPLEEVVEFLRSEYNIEIQLDTFALDELGVGTDEPVTVNLRNITLRSAMRIMLKPLELTYMIKDEVLLITTEDEAEANLVP